MSLHSAPVPVVPRDFRYGRDITIAYPLAAGPVTTRVIEAGSGSRILVCLHGSGARADRWVPAMPGLVDLGYHVYALDFPGHGFADKPADFDYSAKGYSTFVADALDALGLSAVTIAGTSLGGHVGARLAADRPELVNDLILVGAVGLTALVPEEMTAPEVLATATPEAIDRKLRFLIADGDRVVPEWVREESMINSSDGAAHALRSAGRYLIERCNDDLQADRLVGLELDRPILLVWGADDRWVPEKMGRAAHAALPGSDLVLMEGCGHAPYFEDPDGFVQIIEKYRGAIDLPDQ